MTSWKFEALGNLDAVLNLLDEVAEVPESVKAKIEKALRRSNIRIGDLVKVEAEGSLDASESKENFALSYFTHAGEYGECSRNDVPRAEVLPPSTHVPTDAEMAAMTSR